MQHNDRESRAGGDDVQRYALELEGTVLERISGNLF
jgi:hypothetical protein